MAPCASIDLATLGHPLSQAGPISLAPLSSASERKVKVTAAPHVAACLC